MQNIIISNLQHPPQAQLTSRGLSACIRCRSRHVRCGAETPICCRCQARGEQCVYQRSRRGGRRTRKPPQNCESGISFASSEFQLLATQSPVDLSCSGLSSRAADSTDTSSNDPDPDQNNPSLAYGLDRADNAIDDNPINSEKVHSAPTETRVSSDVMDELLNSYYTIFHPAHPCVLPQSFFKQRLEADPQSLRPVLLVMQYIGSLYTPSALSAPLEAQVQDALAENPTASPHSAGYQVQALVLYSIAVYWCNDIDRGLCLLDEAISRAVNLGMNLRSFAAEYGCGNPVLEESWRRTWWVIYVTDAHLAGSTHSYPFKTTNITMNVDLPCEEESYAFGVGQYLPKYVFRFTQAHLAQNIPRPRMLAEYDMREFTEDDGREFSSFAQLIGLARSLGIVFSRGRLSDSDSASALAANFDASIMGWDSLLAQSKRKLLQVDGAIDEHLFRANMLMHTYIVDIHRPLSNLAYSTVESVSRCAPPSPPARAATNGMAVLEVHTSKIIRSIEAVNELLTLSGCLKSHSPFVICMISNTTIAYLSACRYILQDQDLSLAREKIRLNMGVLKALGKCWPLAQRTYREVGVIAREILRLEDRDITMPVQNPLQDISNGLTTPSAFAFDSAFELINFEELGSMNLGGVTI